MPRLIFLLILVLHSACLLAEDGIASGNSALPESAKITRALDQEQMLDILSAEFSVYRNHYNEALDYYLADAKALNDPYLAERATHIAMHQKRYIDMLDAVIIWQKNDPTNPLAHFFTSLAYGFNMQPNIALENMRKVLPLKGETDFTRLVNLVPSGHPSEDFFTKELFQLNQLYPKNYDIPLALAILYQRRDDEKKSLQFIEQAVANSDNNLIVIDYAVRLFERYKLNDKASQTYKKALEKNPANNELRHSYAQFAMRHDLQEAKNQFLYLLKQFPSDDYYIFNMGLIYLENEDLDNAEKMFSTLLDLKKRLSSANFYLGQIAKFQGNNKKALLHFSKITDPNELENTNEQIISIYIEEDKINEALALLDTSLKKSKHTDHSERLQILKAMALQRQGNLQDAYQLLTQLLDKNPDSVELRYSRAMVAETKNELPEMESDLRHIIEKYPDSTLALNALGYTLANKTDRYREALELIQRAQKILPDDPAILDSLGWVLFRLGRVAESLEYLQQAMKIMPDAEVAAHLGEVLWASGRQDEAKTVLRNALVKSPDHAYLTETMKRLNVSP